MKPSAGNSKQQEKKLAEKKLSEAYQKAI